MTLTTSYFPADTSEPVLELTVGDLLRMRAADSPDELAIIEIAPHNSPSLTGADRTDRSWTYAQLRDEAEHCAQWLTQHFEPGDRITVWAPNIPEWVVLQYGAAMAGLILVTANPALRAEELRFVLSQSGSTGLFHADSFRGTDMTAMAREAAMGLPSSPRLVNFASWSREVRGWRGTSRELPVVRPEDPAQIQYTSGTTGTPKGALLHHRGLVTNARYIAVRGGLTEQGRFASAMPLFHTAGCGMSVLGAAHMRSALLLIQAFDPELVLRAMADHRGDAFLGVPTMLIAMLNHPDFAGFDLSACAVAMSGGSSVPPELVRRVEAAFGCRFSTVYGQTELSPIVTQVSPTDSETDKAGTAGKPLWNVEVKIADPVTGEPVPIGEQGEIRARGYQQMIEYYDNPQATDDTVDADRWLHTGDLGTMDSRGYLRVTGRLKDMIIRGGENIYPSEIEQLLFTHPAVEDVAVVGVPDDTWGERVAAILRLRDDMARPTPDELRALCRAHLAPYKTPAQWYVAESFPLTGSGKVQKFRIAELLGEQVYEPLKP
ncbi:fatty-acyl-CoA synthase/long-chain acyl-CoA synthetase [Antricoccus suffuscus]|uniref:Fatty-acyl-CoA synthase/long-chain acyl-CoA synthetase n=1 Tax=Antricoccus suffuscus TaxID=1629062 RepID=A0A2T1A619_9ACTN|nr:AMP-binding protein [Antricoccus suffuscus]PRZ44055.1 fatty-acyl-CoA synthase/long-chain acyl-CoA synthetase [Antricoccus suffuscus]